MSFVKVRVKGPDGKTHQVGNSDAQGVFAFVPAQSGDWEVSASDGMGHKAVLKVAVEPGSQTGSARPLSVASGVSIWGRALWGLAALFFLFGLWFWLAGPPGHEAGPRYRLGQTSDPGQQPVDQDRKNRAAPFRSGGRPVTDALDR